MNGAGQARIERVHRAQHFQRAFRIGHRVAQQRRFVRSMRAIFVPRPGIPRRRHRCHLFCDMADTHLIASPAHF